MLAPNKTDNSLTQVIKTHANRLLLIDTQSGSTITYEEFLGHVWETKQAISHRIGTQRTVIVCAENSYKLFILYMAHWLCDNTIIPLDPQKSEHDKEQIISSSDAQTIILDHQESREGYSVFTLDTLVVQGAKPHPRSQDLFSHIDMQRCCLITYTSGSTGAPKGVKHSLQNLVLSAQSFAKAWKFTENDVFYHCLPMTYIAGILNGFMLPFVCGATLVVGPRFSVSGVRTFWDTFSAHPITRAWMVPTALALLNKFSQKPQGLGSLTFCVGTAPLHDSLKQSFESKFGIKLFESYGQSETLFVTTNTPDHNSNGVGVALEGVALETASDHELLVSVPWMFLGYTTDDPVSVPFASGDLARIENHVQIIGRKKDMIIRGGINLIPKQVEDWIVKQGHAEQAVIFGSSDELLGEKTVCVYTADQELDKSSLNEQIIEEFGKAYLIDELLHKDILPLNTNGKVDKHKIKHDYDTRT